MKQTYNNLEIIAVDDGSTDKSLSILKKLTQSDSRINLLTGVNHGVSYARNRGLEAASGDYVIFVDADDYILPDYLEKLYAYREYDLPVCGYKQLIGSQMREFFLSENLAVGRTEITKIYFDKSILPYMVMPCLKLFRRDLLENYHIRFIDISFGEDTDFVLQYLKCCKTVKLIPYMGYVNRIVPGTLSRKKIINMWGMSQKIIARCENVFENQYDANWQMFYMRLVKNTLVNYCDDEQEFLSVCHVIKDYRFKKTSLRKTRRKNDFITIFLLKIGWLRLLYKMLNFCIGGDKNIRT